MILFARAPVPGRVKTRLAARLGPERAAELHTAFVADMLDLLASQEASADVELHTDTLTDAWAEVKVSRHLQSGGDLGARIYTALQNSLAEGRSRAMIVGSDAPTLPASHLSKLLASPADMALGPTGDGGYYAISCRRVHPEMFRGVRWSRPDVLERTVAAAQRCGLSVELGPHWFDVDTPADLVRLIASGELPRHTAAWIAAQGPGSVVDNPSLDT